MADPFTLEELKCLEQILADSASNAADDRSQATRGGEYYTQRNADYLMSQRLGRIVVQLRKELMMQLDHDGLLVQDFVVVAFRTVEGPRYGFVQSVKDSDEAKDLCKKGFVAVVWPQITRKQSVARFIDSVFQEWLQATYNAL